MLSYKCARLTHFFVGAIFGRYVCSELRRKSAETKNN
nr:MAG TPA: Protein of unknown function (DUF1043) [Caudoviricetes sp.]